MYIVESEVSWHKLSNAYLNQNGAFSFLLQVFNLSLPLAVKKYFLRVFHIFPFIMWNALSKLNRSRCIRKQVSAV